MSNWNAWKITKCILNKNKSQSNHIIALILIILNSFNIYLELIILAARNNMWLEQKPTLYC